MTAAKAKCGSIMLVIASSAVPSTTAMKLKATTMKRFRYRGSCVWTCMPKDWVEIRPSASRDEVVHRFKDSVKLALFESGDELRGPGRVTLQEGR